MYHLIQTMHTNVYEKTEAESNRELQRKKGMERQSQSPTSRERERNKLKKKNKGKKNKTHLLGSRLITADFWRDMSGIAH